jgi:hypothetical protein
METRKVAYWGFEAQAKLARGAGRRKRQRRGGREEEQI